MRYFSFLSFCLLLTACQPEEEKTDLETLTQETGKPFPKAQEESKDLQQQVKKLNIEVERESQKRIEKIHKKLEKEQENK